MILFWFLDCGQNLFVVVLHLPQQGTAGIPGQVLYIFLSWGFLDLYFFPLSETGMGFLCREELLYIIPSYFPELVGKVFQDSTLQWT